MVLEKTPESPTNGGKHVKSNMACARLLIGSIYMYPVYMTLRDVPLFRRLSICQLVAMNT